MEGQMEIGDYISPKHGIKLKIAHDTEIDHWIAERHYLKSTPAGAIVRMEFCTPDNTRLGAMMWGASNFTEGGSRKYHGTNKNVFCGRDGTLHRKQSTCNG